MAFRLTLWKLRTSAVLETEVVISAERIFVNVQNGLSSVITQSRPFSSTLCRNSTFQGPGDQHFPVGIHPLPIADYSSECMNMAWTYTGCLQDTTVIS